MGTDREERKNSAKMRRIKRIAAILAASTVGVTVTGIVAAIISYNAVFPRYERYDYSLTLGAYDYSLYGESLPRRLMSFKSGENRLAAYYYPSGSARGLVALVHGFHAGADDYLPLIGEIVARGYAVFSFDCTGSFDSEGESGIGMCQPLIDLDRALDFIKGDEEMSCMPLYLVGHSLGGYAAASVLEKHKEVRACVLIAPMNDASRVMIDMSRDRVGAVAYATKPVFDIYQRYLFGDYVDMNSVRGINSTSAPILIVQGRQDEIITHDGHSVTARLDEITNPHVQVIWRDGVRGTHDGVWHSVASGEYRLEIEGRIKELEARCGRTLADDERRELYKTVDHRLYSEADGELVDRMIELFDGAVAD